MAKPDCSATFQAGLAAFLSCFEDMFAAYTSMWGQLDTDKRVGALYPKDGDGSAWGDGKLGSPCTLRDNRLSSRIAAAYDDIVAHGCEAWNKLVDQPWTVMNLGGRQGAQGL